MTEETSQKRVLLAFSGGLDTSYLVAWLAQEPGIEVATLTVDCGGFSARELAELPQRSARLGAVAHETVDAKGMLFDRVLRWLIAGNVRRGRTYPLCVAAERGLQAEVLIERAHAGGFEVVAHGCTGAGNDQVRFEAALHALADGLELRAPIREHTVSREEEREFLAANGFALPPRGGAYSVNAGLWGLTIGGGAMLDSEDPLPDEAWCWTQGAATHDSTVLFLDFEDGVPVALNDEELDPVELIERLNDEAGALGVGRGYHIGDTVIGIKGRIAYEAPAAEVLLTAHAELEKLVLTEEQRAWKDTLGDAYGRKLHQGLLHEPFLRDVEAFLQSTQRPVTGRVRLLVQHGRVLVEGLSSVHSMLAATDARYGERPASDSNNQNAAGSIGLAQALAEPARLVRRAQERAFEAEVEHAFELTPLPVPSEARASSVSA
jgi:argininosuccinate synthase